MKEINNEDMINYYKSFVKGKSPSSRKKCPPRRAIVKCFSHKTSEREKTNIIDHISKCSHCTEEFEIIRQIFKAGKEMDEKIENLLGTEEEIEEVRKTANQVVSEIKRKQKLLFPFNKLSPKYLSWALGVLVFSLALFLIFKFSGITKSHEQRGQRKVDFKLVTPVSGKNVTLPLAFKWAKFKDAKYYVLELFDETLILLYESDKIFNNHLIIPQDILKKLKKNETYFWMVTAFTQTGKSTESELQDFKLME